METAKAFNLCPDPNFPLSADAISAFMYAPTFGGFIYALSNLGGCGFYKPQDCYRFYCWLKMNRIKEQPNPIIDEENS